MTIFKHAKAEGYADTNPAESTLNRPVEKQRQRLSKDDFDAIYRHPQTEQWLRNAMDLGLLTLQRESDIVRMEIPEGDVIEVIQKKTGAAIQITIGNQLREVIKRCRDNIVSPYLVHRIPHRCVKAKSKNHPTQVTSDYLCKAFSKARDNTHLFDHLKARERPTYHEIRSLGIVLYEKAGIDPKDLAGHMTEESQKRYKEGHGIEWKKAESF